jgi:TPR repeat protein
MVWFGRQAAEQGDAGAQFILGTMYATGLQNIRIVTVYTPDPGEWDDGLRVRRAK